MTTVLVTNDDGISSPGLCSLATVVYEMGFDVVVAAPAHQSSGASASIIGAERDGRVAFEHRELELLPGVRSYAVTAAPGLIALISAHGAFGTVPDIVLSGVNRGANVGRAILHSGTVGAALTAGVNGARGLAVSLDVGMNPGLCHWDAPAPFVRELIPLLLDSPRGTVFNLNTPNVDTGMQLREGPLAAFGIVQTTMTSPAEEDVRLSVADTPSDQEEGSDAALLAAGYATVTSITSVAAADAPVFALVE